MLNFAILNYVLMNLVWVLIPIAALVIITIIIYCRIKKKQVNKAVLYETMLEMDEIEADMQVHEKEFESVPTKDNVIQFPGTSND